MAVLTALIDPKALLLRENQATSKKAAKRLFRKLLKKQGRAPRVLVTDKAEAAVLRVSFGHILRKT
jgi:transposase-like protein